MRQPDVVHQSRWAPIAIGTALCVLALVALVAWLTQQRLGAWLDRRDARRLDEATELLQQLIARQSTQLTATVALLSEDARIRAMVLTPSFDRATVVDLLSDLEATSGASVVALLDGEGRVRAVVGAPEMDQLNLGTSSLIRNALEKPAAQLWAFASGVGVLSATAVRLDNQVRAIFMMGFKLDDGVLQNLERTIGVTGAVFVGEQLVASASKAPDVEQALRAAAALPAAGHQALGAKLLAFNAPLRDSAVAATVTWIVPRYREAEEVRLAQKLAWAPAILVGLLLALLVALARTQRRGEQT